MVIRKLNDDNIKSLEKLYNSGSNLDITENQAEDYIEEVLGDGK